jgi:HSP20 family molecular chaperone IbpA
VEEIEKDKVNASFRNGVLTMALCNSARAQPADVTPCVPVATVGTMSAS